MLRRRQNQTMQSRLDPVLEYCRREFIRVQELPREAEGVSMASVAEKPESSGGTERRPSMTKCRWSNNLGQVIKHVERTTGNNGTSQQGCWIEDGNT